MFFCLKKYQPGFAHLAQDIWSQFFCKLTLVAPVKTLLYRSTPFFHFLSWLGFPNTLTFSGRNFFSSFTNSGKKYQQGHRTSKNLPAELLVLTYFSFSVYYNMLLPSLLFCKDLQWCGIEIHILCCHTDKYY